MRTLKFVSVLTFASASYAAVDVDDKAPPLDVAKWIVGEPADPSKPDGKTIYVVEFWATWCPPCRASIPRLNQMHHELGDKGVVVIGISSEDAATIEPFAKKTGMQYRVAADKGDATYLAYAEEGGSIPRAFVVRGGTVLWAGSPLFGLDAIVRSLATGTYSRQRAQKARAASKTFDQALQQNDLPGALAALDALIELDPSVMDYCSMKIRLLKHLERVDDVAAVRRRMAVALTSSAGDLAQLAKDILAEEDVRLRDLRVALECAKKAAELTKRKDTAILAVLARAYADVGLCRPAIAALKQAMALEQDENRRRTLRYLAEYVRRLKTCQDLGPGEAD